MKERLFRHVPHPHMSKNAAVVHAVHKSSGNFNQRVAIGMTKIFQSMSTFWLILAWIVLWILANATIVRFDPLPWPLLLCLASVPQLPLMIVIMVGQGLLAHHQEMQSEEQYKAALNTYHDIEQIVAHLDAQDVEVLKIAQSVDALALAVDKLVRRVDAATGRGAA